MMGDLKKCQHQIAEDGLVFWPIFGAEPDDDDPDNVPGDDADDDADDADDEDKDGDGDDADSDDTEDDGDESEDEDTEYWRAKANRLERQKQAADRRATEAERENRRLKQSKKDVLDGPAQEDLKTATGERDSALAEVSTLRLQVALLSDTTHEWHDPALVIQSLAADDSVEIDEDGKIVGVKRALARLAKSKPYLVKTAGSTRTTKPKDDGKADEKTAPATRSGSPMNGKTTSKDKVDRAALLKQYPHLSRR